MKILTFDLEEWFHILDNDSTKNENDWINYESRIHSNMDKIYEILDATNLKASFFVLGWIAEKYPELIREICDRGHEIGSHTHLHQLVYEQDRIINQKLEEQNKTLRFLENQEQARKTRRLGQTILNLNRLGFFNFLN